MGTKIEYVRGKVLEVTGGCTECSVGCENCWARKEVWRMAHNPLLGDKWKGLVKKTSAGLRWTGKIKLFEDALQIPLKRKKPTIYFVDSKADLFHKDVPFEVIHQTYRTIYSCEQHTFLLLTKRIKRAAEYYRCNLYTTNINAFPNLHLGVTICNEDEMWKADILTRIPAAAQFISFEPLLSAVEILPTWLYYKGTKQWVVVGCESGPKRRPCKLEHIRSIVDQCDVAGVGCFVKQIPINGKVEHDMSKFPKDLQVRDEI